MIFLFKKNNSKKHIQHFKKQFLKFEWKNVEENYFFDQKII